MHQDLCLCICSNRIYIELTSDFMVNTFLASFTHFLSLRGCPLTSTYNNNGLGFLETEKEPSFQGTCIQVSQMECLL